MVQFLVQKCVAELKSILSIYFRHKFFSKIAEFHEKFSWLRGAIFQAHKMQHSPLHYNCRNTKQIQNYLYKNTFMQ